MLTANADGVMVCSSNGSSAYNSSLKGPLMTPGCTGLSLSLMAPFGVNSVPIVIPSTKSFKVRMSAKNWQTESKLINDSHSEFTLKRGQVARIYIDPKDTIELITEDQDLMESWLPKVQGLFKWETS